MRGFDAWLQTGGQYRRRLAPNQAKSRCTRSRTNGAQLEHTLHLPPGEVDACFLSTRCCFLSPLKGTSSSAKRSHQVRGLRHAWHSPHRNIEIIAAQHKSERSFRT
jgi:hypothetical protein